MGDLGFIGESLDVSNAPGLFVLTYTVEPSSATAEAMEWLGSWTATPPDRVNFRDSSTTADRG